MCVYVCVCVCDEPVAVRTTYTDRRISLLCVLGKEGDYAALKTITMRDKLRQEQGSLWLGFSLSVHVCLCVCEGERGCFDSF